LLIAAQLGVRFAQENGEGFNILLQALPTDAKFVLKFVLRTCNEKPRSRRGHQGKFTK
jgi:hypothetical protein